MNGRMKAAEAGRLFATGLEHQRHGRLEAAKTCYEQGLRLAPGQPDATFLLGQLLYETGQRVQGESLMRQAIAANPSAANYWRGLAIQLYNQGRFDDACTAFERARALYDEPEARFGHAAALEAAGRLEAALAVWRERARSQPQDSGAWLEIGRLSLRSGNATEAMAAAERHLQLSPDSTAGWLLQCDAKTMQGDHAAALNSLVQAATLAPGDAALRSRLAQALFDAGLCDAAFEQLDEALRIEPTNAAIHFQRGVAHAALGQGEAACAAYEAALRIDPDAPAILTNLANQYAALKRNEEARTLYRHAIEVAPEFAPAHFNLGMLLIDEGRRLDAEVALGRACALAPDNGLMAAHLLFQRMHLCRWQGLDQLAAAVARAVAGDGDDIPPFIVLSMPGTTPSLQRQCAENHSRRLALPPLPAGVRPERGGRRLRVGYLSSDFKNHATAYLLAEMLEAHDRSRFEVFGLSYGVDDGSAMRARIAVGVEHFIDLAACVQEEAVARIAALELDMLIDLKGYTEGNHSEWLSCRLAPVQINWLGYPGTMGAPWIDYLIADAVVAPLSNQSMFSEHLLHLPGSYQPNCRERICTARPLRGDEGLPETALVLCSFNQTYKVTPAMFSCWLEILRQLPDAVLWLWASNPWAEDALRAAATAAGIAPGRLVFAEGRPQPEHLARLPLADLALDTFPCNGHTTTSDALWAGVPVVTLQGEAFAARVAGSLLAVAGLDELIVRSEADYVATVVRLGRDREALRGLQRRAAVLRGESDMFDGRAFAGKLEALLLDVGRLHGIAC
ncbi:MAG: tetratricopeptide repeat protein [Rhodocyclales bacterium]|nr:tetratricopeptide repeat protein [Rhodocyclales bacterium]